VALAELAVAVDVAGSRQNARPDPFASGIWGQTDNSNVNFI